jgi:hypothetical protein
MQRILFLTGFILCGWLMSASSSSAASLDVSVDFYASLAPYGDWLEHERFGTVWAPRQVEPGWRPYSHGEWVYTDDGWTWASDEDWGWATDHYGRWYFDRSDGWLWLPGDEWAPAWVAWRYGEGYVGWAPLPPEVDAFGDDFSLELDPFVFCFVEERHFLEPHVHRHFFPVARNVTYVHLTQDFTRYRHRDRHVVNLGIDVGRFERAMGRAVPRGQIHEVRSPAEARRVRMQRGQVALFRPSATMRRPDDDSHVPAMTGTRFKWSKPDQVGRHQEQERRRLETDIESERRQLHKIQQREVKHAPVLRDGRDAERSRVQAERRAASVGRERLRERHEAEQKAQAEHEARERELLEQRHAREKRADEDRKDKQDIKDDEHSGSARRKLDRR